MRGEQEAIEAEGARLAFVGSGNTPQARDFQHRHAPGNAVFTDPSAYTYRAIGARSGLGSTVGGTIVHGLRAMRGGHFQTSIEGRPFQHGGVLVALPGDVLGYAYISRMAGDHPENAAVIGALRDAVRAAASPPPSAITLPPELATGEAATPPPPATMPPPAMPAWPGTPPGYVAPRRPRWSFDMPESRPPHSAAG